MWAGRVEGSRACDGEGPVCRGRVGRAVRRWNSRRLRSGHPLRRSARGAPGRPSGAGRALRRGGALAYLAEEPFGFIGSKSRERVPAVQVAPAARGRRYREGHESFAGGDCGGGRTGSHDDSPVSIWFRSPSFRRLSCFRNRFDAFAILLDRNRILATRLAGNGGRSRRVRTSRRLVPGCRPEALAGRGGLPPGARRRRSASGRGTPVSPGGGRCGPAWGARGGSQRRHGRSWRRPPVSPVSPGPGPRRSSAADGQWRRRGRCSGSRPAGRSSRATASRRRGGSSPR